MQQDQLRKQDIREGFDQFSSHRARWQKKAGYYYEDQLRYLRFLVPEGLSVLEIGCGLGDQLAELKPKRGLGIDFSAAMIKETAQFFSMAFSWLLGERIKDALCGTKVLFRRDHQRIAANRAYFGDFDPFGDFDLLFGASKLNLKIIEVPVRYQERTYGPTNINRFQHGWLLLKMTAYGFLRLKAI